MTAQYLWESHDNDGYPFGIDAYYDGHEVYLTVNEAWSTAQASLSPTTARALAAALIQAADQIDPEKEDHDA